MTLAERNLLPAESQAGERDTSPDSIKNWTRKSHEAVLQGVEAVHRARMALLQSGKYASLASVADQEIVKAGAQGFEAYYLSGLLAEGMEKFREGRRIIHVDAIPLSDRLAGARRESSLSVGIRRFFRLLQNMRQ